MPWLLLVRRMTVRPELASDSSARPFGGAAIGVWPSSLPYFSLDNFYATPGLEGRDALLEDAYRAVKVDLPRESATPSCGARGSIR
jgi:hypothetical protein